ncbi:MAG: ABC transporter permease [Deltaproteobacteria bacterium]|jgi:NitT/TauT family transport system permease protein|nr:ABC transporter permease [Deltaproteobacteria bacterium]
MPRVAAGLALLAFVGLWQTLALALGDQVLPTPAAVAADFWLRLGQPEFHRHLLASLWRGSAGFFLGLVTAIPLGWLMGRLKTLDAFLAPLLFLTYPVPKVLFLPVLLVTLGLGEAPKIILVAVTVGYQALVVTRDSALNLDPAHLEAFDSLCPPRKPPLAKALALTRHVLWPASLPAVLTAARLASGTAVSVLFMAESFATDLGLGYFIMDAWGNLDLPKMFSGILAMGLLGGMFYVMSVVAEKTWCPWVKA